MTATSKHRPIDATRVLHRLFTPDELLPSQYFATQPRQGPSKTAEHALLLAVLNDALRCFLKYLHAKNRREQLLFKEAEIWIMSAGHLSKSGSRDPAFSFEYVCEVLGIDAAYLRGGLQHWRTMQRAANPSIST